MQRSIISSNPLVLRSYKTEGMEKKFALEKFLDSQFSYEKCPAKLVLELTKSYVLTNINRNEVEDKYDW